jgi:hypothetical protein
MNVGDLIAELQKFPELSTVFFQRGDEIVRLDSTHEIWVKSADGNALHGPYTEIETDIAGRLTAGADDYGVLLYG